MKITKKRNKKHLFLKAVNSFLILPSKSIIYQVAILQLCFNFFLKFKPIDIFTRCKLTFIIFYSILVWIKCICTMKILCFVILYLLLPLYFFHYSNKCAQFYYYKKDVHHEFRIINILLKKISQFRIWTYDKKKFHGPTAPLRPFNPSSSEYFHISSNNIIQWNLQNNTFSA